MSRQLIRHWLLISFTPEIGKEVADDLEIDFGKV